jgi:hypothetical protein
VSSHLPIPLPQLISDVEVGIGIIKNVLAAPRDGPSMEITFAFQLPIYAQPTERMEPAFHAIRDTTLRMVLAFTQLSTMPSPLILAVPPGIGIIKFAFPAQRHGPLTQIKFVFPFLTNALLTVIMEPVFHASRDTTLRMEPVSSPHSTTLNPLIPDVPLGIGIIKFVFHAPNNGPSMLIKSAFQFLTNALLMPITELAFHASRDTTLRTEPVSSPHSKPQTHAILTHKAITCKLITKITPTHFEWLQITYP